MLKIVFVWGFVALPLTIALALIGYQVRYFILAILAITVVAAAAWGVLRLGSDIDSWWEAAPPSRAPPPCLAQPGGEPVGDSCAL